MKCLNMSSKKQKGLHIRLQMWNGKSKTACTVTTFKGIIGNMIIGVTEVSSLKRMTSSCL